MKRFVFISVILAVLMTAFSAFAEETDFNAVRLKALSEDTYQIEVQNSSGTRVFSVDSSGNTYISGTLSNSRERSIPLPLMGFLSDTDASPLSTSSNPGLEIDDLIPNIVWADGETTPVVTTFRVPSDYSSGGAFRLLCTESDSTTPNQVDFDVYVNRSGSALDAAATGQTPVALGTGSYTATPVVVTLTPATDFASLAAGDWVTLRIWRDNAAAGTGDLEVKGVEFYYTASQ